MYSQHLSIGSICFSFFHNDPLKVTTRLIPFLCNPTGCTHRIRITLRITDAFDVLPAQIITYLPRMIVMQDATGALEYRLFLHPITNAPIALYREISDNEIQLDILRAYTHEIQLDENLLEFIALEKHLIARHSIILHSSSIETPQGVILFSAPSGTGKSTQADLWHRYRGSRILNGDRNILHRTTEGDWLVQGLPFCGSSGICCSDTHPLRAIARLRQAPIDRVILQSASESLKHILSETTVNTWNSRFVNSAVDLCSQLSMRHGTCLLDCTISENAIIALEEYLKKEVHGIP